ncbi:dephospho-CoA kinase [Parapedobacter koreensis]|uniref:Dephospho-CoA kinase n=1 Tax=Parapedobacter koreensis TaxID=332977 RepID=A0A1H7M6F6_9SPHI|nr:dephospho-CoA kinase [Parapedobacter koreensis]SEL06187.1 dephospho-CoA kinase [Parapedobacter koreensis]
MQSLKIGVTGGIGSGKSTICRIFSVLGIPVFDADREARRLMTADAGLVRAIQAEFGREAYQKDGSLNRAYLAAQVFNDRTKLKQLNALVHPVVIQAGEAWAAEQDAPYTIKEAALLFESGSFKLNHYNILVKAPEAIRIERVIKRDGVTAEQVRSRMAQQWPEAEKESLADEVIFNDGVQAVIPQVLKLDHFFRTQRL